MKQSPVSWDEDAPPSGRGLTCDVLIASVFTAVALVTSSQRQALPVLAALTMGAALTFRRLSWLAMVTAAVASAACQLLAGELSVMSDLGYAVVGFALGSHARAGVRRLGMIGATTAAVVLAVAVSTGTIGEAVTVRTTSFASVAAGAMALLVAGGGWGAGYVRWQSRQRLRAQVRAGWERERTLIAADMHDLVAHTWAVVAAQADGARYALGTPAGERKAAASLELIAETARGSIADVRQFLAEMRFREDAISSTSASRRTLLERVRASGMEVRVERYGRPSGSTEFAVLAQRLLAESLTNALKHGDLQHPVRVEEDWRGGYRLLVRNQIRESRGEAGSGHGVGGMRARVISAGGSIEAGACEGAWTVRAVLPELSA